MILQIGGTVGALCGAISSTLQFSVSGGHGSAAATGAGGGAIITGSTMLFFVIGIGTGVIPSFTGPAFDILEAEHVASPKLKPSPSPPPGKHNKQPQPHPSPGPGPSRGVIGELHGGPRPGPSPGPSPHQMKGMQGFDLEAPRRPSGDSFNTYIYSPAEDEDGSPSGRELESVAEATSSAYGRRVVDAEDEIEPLDLSTPVARKRSNASSRSTDSDLQQSGEEDGLLGRRQTSALERGEAPDSNRSSRRKPFPSPKDRGVDGAAEGTSSTSRSMKAANDIT